MANHSSALKRVRSSRKKRLKNRYQRKSTTTFLDKLMKSGDKSTSVAGLKRAYSMLDRLAKCNVIHANKASRLKSKVALQVASFA